MKVCGFKVMPFCENWARLVNLRDDEGKLRFFMVFMKTAFDDWTPTDDTPIEEQADYLIIAPVIANHSQKVAAGKAGGRSKKHSEAEYEA